MNLTRNSVRGYMPDSFSDFEIKLNVTHLSLTSFQNRFVEFDCWSTYFTMRNL